MMRRTGNWSFGAGASVIALAAAFAAPVGAQTSAPAAPVAAPADEAATQDIVVTAQKRSERLLDVPLSITAIGGAALSTSGVNSTRDLAQVVPGLVTASTGLSFQPAIRGVSSAGTYAGDEANVSTYIDDVYIPAQFSGLFQLTDIERIEVLKGPQGTLFGRNATGGAIRVVTRDPSFTTKAEVTGSYGFATHERKFTGYATTGLTKTIAASVSGYYDKDDGYLNNVAPGWTGGKLGSLREYTVRGKLMWEPSADAKFVLAVDGGNSRNSAAYSAAIINNNDLYRNNAGYVAPTGKFDVSLSLDPIETVKNFGTSLNGTVNLGFASLKSVSGYRLSRIRFFSDNDRSNLNLGSVYGYGRAQSYSQEFDLSSTASGPFSWILGAYGYYADSSLGFDQYTGTPFASALGSAYTGDVKTTSYAPFADATYKLTSKLSVTGGLRYTYERKKYHFFDTNNPAGPLRNFNDATSFNNVSYRAIVEYKPTSNYNLYASYTTGFKSGVYNATLASRQVADPEHIYALEVGLKGKVSSTFSFTAAVYRYIYKNMQQVSYDNRPGILLVVLSNASQAKIFGADFDLVAKPITGVTLQGGISYLPTAKYSNFPAALAFFPLATGGNRQVAPYDASGTRMIRAPKVSLNASLGYETAVGNGKAGFNIAWAYKSSYIFNVAAYQTNPDAVQKPYSLVNGEVSYTFPGDHLKVAGFFENILNERYGVYTATTVVGNNQTIGRPREGGIRLSYKY